MAVTAPLGRPARRGPRGTLERPARREQRERRGRLAPEETLVCKARLALRGTRERRGRLARWELPGTRVPKVRRGLRVTLEQLEQLDPRAQSELPGILVRKARPGLPEQLGQQAQRVQLAPLVCDSIQCKLQRCIGTRRIRLVSNSRQGAMTRWRWPSMAQTFGSPTTMTAR